MGNRFLFALFGSQALHALALALVRGNYLAWLSHQPDVPPVKQKVVLLEVAPRPSEKNLSQTTPRPLLA